MRSTLTVTLILAASLSLQAQEMMPFSLREAMDYAMEHNTEVVNAGLDLEIARKRVWESTASGLPQVNASVSYQDMLELPVSLIPAEFFGGEPGTFQEIRFGTQHNAAADITVNQLIFNGPYIVGLQAARSYQLMQAQNLGKKQRDVKAQVAEAYYFALLSQEMASVMKKSVGNMEKTYSDAVGMVKAGLLEETEADQLRVALSGIENSQRNMERQFILATSLLKFHMGIAHDQGILLTDDLGEIMKAINIAGLTILSGEAQDGFNVGVNLDYKAAMTGLILSEHQWNLERTSYLPTLSAFYTRKENAMRNEFDFIGGEGDWYPSSILGVTLSIPITSSGMRNAKVQQAKLNYEKTKNTVDMLKRSLDMEAVQAGMDLSTAYENYLVQQENITLARKILDRTLIRYSEGMATGMEVTQASDQLLRAETNYASAVVDILNAKLRLDVLTSRL